MAGQPLSARRRVVTLVAMCVAQGMILLDNTIVNVALPSIQRELDVDPANLLWVVNAYVLALASLILVGGTLGDRYGRKRVFIVGLAIFTAMSAACALSPNESALIAARAAQGVGAALVAPLSLSILVDAYPPERRTAAIGIWAAAAGLGFGAGPVVGGILVELFSWSAVFWVNVPVGIIGLVLVITGVRESRNPNARRLDLPGAVLVATGLCVLTFAIVESEQSRLDITDHDHAARGRRRAARFLRGGRVQGPRADGAARAVPETSGSPCPAGSMRSCTSR